MTLKEMKKTYVDVVHMIHPKYGEQFFIFSPICEITTIFDYILCIPRQITLFELIESGWEVK